MKESEVQCPGRQEGRMENSPHTPNTWSFVTARSTKSWFACISLFAVLIRLAVALHPYSGAATPPMFGDYEAQRHWMEITLNLPVKDWYRNSTLNDLRYWGLDYPPLTAYQSYAHGILLRFFDPASVSLLASRGYESYIGFLLGKCLRRQNPLFEVLKLGLVVLGTFALVWWPYVYSVDAFMEVLSRLAPFERGIYEDYVANFWCATSIVIKWKRLFSTEALRLLCLSATALTCIPSMIQLVQSPTKNGFLYGLLNSSFAFYLFSYQVHEKSILLPLLPASFLAMEEPFIFQLLTHHGLLSMFPLLKRDNLVLPYAALSGLFALLYYTPGGRNYTRETNSFSPILKFILFSSSLLLHLIYMILTPPGNYPFLFEAIIMIFCFAQFVLIFIFLNTKQWTLLKTATRVNTKKKSL